MLRVTSRSFSRSLQRKIMPFGIPIGMWYFLRVLWEEDGTTEREISRRIQTMEPTTAIALRGMEERGFITRRRNLDDKRKMNIYLTDVGRALGEQLIPVADELELEGMRGIDDQKAEIFWEVLKTIRENLPAKSRICRSMTDSICDGFPATVITRRF